MLYLFIECSETIDSKLFFIDSTGKHVGASYFIGVESEKGGDVLEIGGFEVLKSNSGGLFNMFPTISTLDNKIIKI